MVLPPPSAHGDRFSSSFARSPCVPPLCFSSSFARAPPVPPPTGHGEEGAAGPQGRSPTPRAGTFGPGSHSLPAAATLITFIRSVAPQQPLPGGQGSPAPPCLRFALRAARCSLHGTPASACPCVFGGAVAGPGGGKDTDSLLLSPPGWGKPCGEEGGSAPSPFSRPLCSLAAHPPEHQVPCRLLRGALGRAGRPARCCRSRSPGPGCPNRGGGAGHRPPVPCQPPYADGLGPCCPRTV